MTRLLTILLAIAATVVIAGCGSSTKPATQRATAPPICVITEAGNKLCGEQADIYCREYGGDSNPCIDEQGEVLKAIAHGDTEAGAQWRAAKAATPLP
jgi:hypothetical protein